MKKSTVLFAEIYDLFAFFVLTIWIILFIRFFIFTPYTVVGSSMYPTFKDWDRIIVEKFTQNFSTFARGDVIIFVPPEKKIPYIKRVIAFPGETVLVKNQKVYICSKDITTRIVVQSQEGLNCEQLDESYLPQGVITEAACGQNEFKVEWWYFAMGDNRGHTTDSLCCFWIQCFEGANFVVPNNLILWKARVRLYPDISKDF